MCIYIYKSILLLLLLILLLLLLLLLLLCIYRHICMEHHLKDVTQLFQWAMFNIYVANTLPVYDQYLFFRDHIDPFDP